MQGLTPLYALCHDREVRRGAWAGALGLGIVLGAGPAAAQVFLATHPDPVFTVGPLFVRATVTPALGPVPVELLWSLTVPPTQSPLGLEQDVYLLWPGPIRGDGERDGADPAMAEYFTSRGFRVLRQGRLPLLEEDLYPTAGAGPAERRIGEVAYVTFSREGLQALGVTSAATYVRIPWAPALLNRTRLVKLRLVLDDAIRPRRATWIEDTFRGRRHVLSIGFNDVREQTLFPVYLENRARAIRLANEPSQLLIRFTDGSRLRVDDISPPTGSRRPGGPGDGTELVSVFLDTTEGGAPQELTVQFGYASRLQAWAPFLIPLAFFVLGRAAGPLVERIARRVGSRVAARVHFGRQAGAAGGREEGVILTRETLARIVPGRTTRDEVLALCGPDVREEREALGGAERRTLVYHGRRVVPQRLRRFAWFATVQGWEVEEHEVEIALEADRVSNIQAAVRRTHPPSPDAA